MSAAVLVEDLLLALSLLSRPAESAKSLSEKETSLEGLSSVLCLCSSNLRDWDGDEDPGRSVSAGCLLPAPLLRGVLRSYGSDEGRCKGGERILPISVLMMPKSAIASLLASRSNGILLN